MDSLVRGTWIIAGRLGCRLRLLVANLAARLLVWAESGLPSPLTPEAAERMQDCVMAEIAANHGEGMARRQLAAAEMARHLALGDRADVGGRRETYQPKRHDD